MQLSAELTLYPFHEEYKPAIKAFIARLNQYDEITVQTFPTATIVRGDDVRVMEVIRDMLRWNIEHQGRAALVAKFLPDYAAI